jgi:(p)ppGpp synthase/HD superfamily hydrolase
VVGLAAHGVNEQRIYVFTPDGHVVDLPVGSTPLDFAYHIHTDIGHRCRAARVNGKRVALNRPLQTADRVEIFTVKQGAPSRRWLRTARGYLASSRAREKIRQWFSRQRDSDLASGERHWLLTLEVSDRRGLLLDVTRALSSFGVNIAALHTSDLDASQKSMQLELTHLFEGDQAALIAVLEQLPAVGSASLVPQPLAVDSESQP